MLKVLAAIALSIGLFTVKGIPLVSARGRVSGSPFLAFPPDRIDIFAASEEIPVNCQTFIQTVFRAS
jgi:hypothetical protein